MNKDRLQYKSEKQTELVYSTFETKNGFQADFQKKSSNRIYISFKRKMVWENEKVVKKILHWFEDGKKWFIAGKKTGTFYRPHVKWRSM